MNSTRVFLVLIAGVVIASLLFLRLHRSNSGVSIKDAERAAGVHCSQVSSLFRTRQSGTWVSVSGEVARVLPDETGAFQHQRFILSCSSRQTVLIVNDISIGQRVPVRVGVPVVVHGQYVWNAQGGLVHFTHHAEGGGQGGWIEYHQTLYSLGPPPNLTLEPSD